MVSIGLDEFLKYIRNIEQLNRMAIADEQQANDETQDILHSLELEEHDYHSTAHLAKKLKRYGKNVELQKT